MKELTNGYAICPNSWLFDERIQNELRLLLLISSLSAKYGYCYANNEFLGEKLGKSIDTISSGISKLKKYGYIEVEVEKFGAVITNRKIRLLALERLNQSPTENLPSANGMQAQDDINSVNLPMANGEFTVANGKNTASQRKICRSPYNVSARDNNTSNKNYKPLILQTEYINTHACEKNLTPKNDNVDDDGLPNPPCFVDKNLWKLFKAYSKQINKRLSVMQVDVLFANFKRWHDEGINVNYCISESMARGYKSVFRLEEQKYEDDVDTGLTKALAQYEVRGQA